ncbi:MAG: hypothetical protein JO005_09515 [Gammaproteobacteria bacterium]|nr:hypothetical protein [Gammaproteobacteria bacterium]
MGQTSDQIESQIETRREDLRSNLEELEDKVKSATDWRQQFRNNTGTMLAIAFGGGLLLSGVLGRGSRRSYRAPSALPERAPRRSSPRVQELRQTWDHIQSALIGVAASKVKDTLADFIPGFREQISRRDPYHQDEHQGHAGESGYAGSEQAEPRH